MPRPKAFDEEAVLEKAVNLFWCRGYEATSIQDLVDGLGINRASLYDTYGDKQELYRKALASYQKANQRNLCAFLNQSRPAVELLQELLENAVRESVNDPDRRGCFIANSAVELASHDPVIAHIVVENQRGFEELLQRTIERGQREGSINQAHSAVDLARFLFTTFSGLKVVGKSQPDPEMLGSIVRVAVSTLR